jgi:hypothetical protein
MTKPFRSTSWSSALICAITINLILGTALLQAAPSKSSGFPSSRYTDSTAVSGDVSGVWNLAGSPYVVDGTITVANTDSLIIEPGVEVIFDGNYQFIVDGYLYAVGGAAEGDTIHFTASDPLQGWGGMRMVNAHVSSRLEYCHFEGGWANGAVFPDNCGGALYIFGSIYAVKHCSFVDNQAALDGGAVYMWGATPAFEYNRFVGNHADHGLGHALYMGSCPGLVLNHLTITQNDTSVTDTLSYSLYVTSMNFAMQNSIIWDSFLFPFVNASVSYSVVDTLDSDSLSILGDGNLNVDPIFIDAENYNLHLRTMSPCIDGASILSPYGNEPEPNGNHANMGAYANSIGASYSVPVVSFASDSLYVDLDPDSTDFGLQKISTSGNLNVPIYNLGSQPYDIYGLDITTTQFTTNFDDLVDTTLTPAAIRIQPDSTKTLTLTFTPDALGFISANLTLDDNDDSSNVVLLLSGTGVDPVIQVNPTTFDFGLIAVGDYRTMPVTVSNTGASGDLIVEFYRTSTNFFLLTPSGSTAGNQTIPIGNSITDSVGFEPLGAGTFYDSLFFENNAGDDFYIYVSGSAEEPSLRWEPHSLDFGVVSVGLSDTLEFFVWNPYGGVDLVLYPSDFEITENMSSNDFTFISSDSIIAPSDTVYFGAVFHPDSAGTYHETLSIPTNMPDEDEVEVQLLGTGTSQINWVIGDQTGTWVADSITYYVVGDIHIPEGETLTIEPGVSVKFEGDFEIIIDGTLDAQGTPADSIEFSTINLVDSTWSGITFNSGASSASVMRHCYLHRGEAADSTVYGGAMRIEAASPTIDSCVFHDNAAHRGGALALYAQSEALISGCTFYENTANEGAGQGGAIYVDWYANSEIAGCEFYADSALYGGAIYLAGAFGEINSCMIHDNYAATRGGGICIGSGSTTELYENDVYSNVAGSGGGLAIQGFSRPYIHNESYYLNTADTTGGGGGTGGGLFIQDGCNPVILQTLVAENAAALGGQALHTLGSGALIDYCTFVAAADSNDGWLLKAEVGDQSMISNSILWGTSWSDSSFAPLSTTQSDVTITYSSVVDTTLYPGLNNTNTDPEFQGTGDIDEYYAATSAALQSWSEDGGEIGFTGGTSEMDWTITLVLLQNAVQSSDLEFVLTSTIPLTSPPYMYLEQDLPDTLEYVGTYSAYMTQIAPMIYLQSLFQSTENLGYPSIATFSLNNIMGVQTELVQDFIAANLSATNSVVTYGDVLIAQARAVNGTGVWGIMPEYYAEPKPLDPELEAIGLAYQVFWSGTDLAEGQVEFNLSEVTLQNHATEGLGIARWNDEGSWEILPAFLNADGSSIWMDLGEAGTYRLVWGENIHSTVLLPAEVSLHQNYPNPFNPETLIGFSLPESERVKLEIYNVMGRRVATLVDDNIGPGFHQARWMGTNAYGMPAASGIYIYRLEVGGQILSKKMILLR